MAALPAALDLMRRLPPKRTADSINDVLDVAGDEAEARSDTLFIREDSHSMCAVGGGVPGRCGRSTAYGHRSDKQHTVPAVRLQPRR